MSEWKPGDVAMVLNKWGVWNVAICAVRSGVPREFAWSFGVTDDDVPLSSVEDVRPLVVIDPEDAEQVERLISLYVDHGERLGYAMPEYQHLDRRLSMAAALREFARPTPRIEEPQGLGAVVEDAEGTKWVRSRNGAAALLGVVWENPDSLAHRAWQGINAVRILSPGVEAES